jgi:hypothetical protein
VEPVASVAQPGVYDDHTQAFPELPMDIPAPPPLPPRTVIRRDSADLSLLPNPAFDGEPSEWHVVRCKLAKLALKGVQLQRSDQTALLAWKKIHTVSVGRLRIIDPANAAKEKTFILIDLITQNLENTSPVLYRLQSDEIAFQKIFPGVDQTFEEALSNFMGIVIKNSSARCLPNQESCIGPNFATYPELSRYEIRLREKL